MSCLEAELSQPLPVHRHLLSLLRRAVFHCLLPTGRIGKKKKTLSKTSIHIIQHKQADLLTYRVRKKERAQKKSTNNSSKREAARVEI